MAALDADAVLIEHYDPDEIAWAPIGNRLSELEPALPVAASLPAAELLNFLKADAFVTMLAIAAVLLVGVNVCNLYTISSQRDQIRDLKIATDTKPAQLQQILALNESKACRGHMYVAYRLAEQLLDKAPSGGSSD